MAHSKPHTLDQLRRAFAELWEDLGANHDGEEAQGMRTSLAVTLLELAGAGERSRLITRSHRAIRRARSARRIRSRAPRSGAGISARSHRAAR